MAQFKIPQEINVEDKVVGPFTLKSFGFVFVFFLVTTIFLVILRGAGLSFATSLIIGALLGSPLIAFGFFPFNGKPLYVYAGSFVSFLFKPRKRVWKKVNEQVKAIRPEDAQNQVKKVEVAPQKASIEDAEKRIEEISLMVDTGGAYGMNSPQETESGPATFMEKDNVAVERALKEYDKTAEHPQTEPLISDLATVDKNKEFKYERPDTSDYKLNEVLEEEKKER